jgi:hypothetical protein
MRKIALIAVFAAIAFVSGCKQAPVATNEPAVMQETGAPAVEVSTVAVTPEAGK